MFILSFLFNIITKLRNYCYDKGIFKINKIDNCKIICIGNITVGGTGKTPAVQYFAKKYIDLGYKVAIISRGYGGKRKLDPMIVSDGIKILSSPKESGDEPYLHGLNLKVPIIVGRSRYRAAKVAVDKFKSNLIIMDDGFQHRQINRDKNIVLIDATNPFGSFKLIPSGRLREDIKGLNRADEFVITKSSLVAMDTLKEIKDYLKQYNIPISVANHKPISLYDVNLKDVCKEEIIGKNILLVSGLANPKQFEDTVKNFNPSSIERMDFKDHNDFTEKDLIKIQNRFNSGNYDYLIITEKDFVKLDNLLNIKPLLILKITFFITEDNICWSL